MLERAEFESGVVGREIYVLREPVDRAGLPAELDACAHHIIAKTGARDVRLLELLREAGFFWAATSVCLDLELNASYGKADPDVKEIGGRSPDAAHFEICDQAFAANNRFANDPLLGEHSRNIHRTWLVNSLDGYAQYCCHLLLSGAPAGFGTLHCNGSEATIGLLAVSAHHRGRRLGSRLVEHLIHVCAAKGITRLLTASEAENAAALNLYVSQGFRFHGADIALYRRSR